MRADGRQANQLRPVTITPDFTIYAEGSVLISFGNTRVLCNATVEDKIPRWMQAQNIPGGWISGEYAMLPRATQTRTPRENRGLGGRTQEIRRLIGRSLRAAVDLKKLGYRTCIVDCDVLQADGGTRTAAITGGYVALEIALRKLIDQDLIPESILLSRVAAVSVGVIEETPLLDLCYQEDFAADVDANIVMNSLGQYIEVQATAEGPPIDRQTLDRLLDLARQGIDELLVHQDQILNNYR